MLSVNLFQPVELRRSKTIAAKTAVPKEDHFLV
jgi:hypothetical protein